jgi:hypothetical protein
MDFLKTDFIDLVRKDLVDIGIEKSIKAFPGTQKSLIVCEINKMSNYEIEVFIKTCEGKIQKYNKEKEMCSIKKIQYENINTLYFTTMVFGIIMSSILPILLINLGLGLYLGIIVSAIMSFNVCLPFIKSKHTEQLKNLFEYFERK